MESPQALMCPLEKWISGINKSSSDDRPGPGICDSKYVEDAKAARSVRVWDRVPMKDIVRGIETGHQMPGRRIMKRWSCTARSLREDQALLLRRRLPLVPRAASPHGDNLAASHNASASHIYRHYTNILSGRR
jgi:hypothetical protein